MYSTKERREKRRQKNFEEIMAEIFLKFDLKNITGWLSQSVEHETLKKHYPTYQRNIMNHK